MITINDLTFRMMGRTLFEKAGVNIDVGAKAGLVGRNGAGKTTLFKLITGDLEPESGTISIPKGVRIGQVAQEAPGTEKSLIETVLAADTERARLLAEAETASDPHRIADIHMRLADIDAHSAEARAASILAGLGFDQAAQNRPCSAFSGGWRMRVALAAVLFSEPDLLMLDEPTNYLDLEGTLWLENYIARYRHTVIIISHDRDLLNKACNSIIHLEQRGLTFYRGNYDTFERTRSEKLALQTKAAEKQEARRKHMEAFVNRFRAKASKARQAQSRIKALEKMQEIKIAVDERVAPITFPDPVKQVSSPIINLEGVSVGYDPEKPVLTRLNLRLDADDRIALLGANGNGKSTFAKLIAGRLQPSSGTVTRADKLKIAIFAQHQLDDLVPEQNAYEHLRKLMPDQPESKVRGRVARMGLSSEKMDTPAGALSGGERARLLLGLVTFEGPHLLILDEPTNHLDIDSREELMMALNAYQGAVMVISHDRHLVEASADRLWLVNNGSVQPYDGDMEDYKRLILKGTDAGTGKARGETTRESAKPRQAEEARPVDIRETKKRLRQLETIMEKAETGLIKIDERLSDASMTNDVERIRQLSEKKAEFARRLAEVEKEWLKLGEALENVGAAN